MDDLPNLQEQTIPYLPRRLVSRYDGVLLYRRLTNIETTLKNILMINMTDFRNN
jgi:hypothetical protein